MKEKLILCTVLLALSTSSFAMKNSLDDPNRLFDFAKTAFTKGGTSPDDERSYRSSDQVFGKFMAVGFSGEKDFYYLKKYECGKEDVLWIVYETEDWCLKDTPFETRTELPRNIREMLEGFLKEEEQRAEIVAEFENPLRECEEKSFWGIFIQLYKAVVRY